MPAPAPRLMGIEPRCLILPTVTVTGTIHLTLARDARQLTEVSLSIVTEAPERQACEITGSMKPWLTSGRFVWPVLTNDHTWFIRST